MQNTIALQEKKPLETHVPLKFMMKDTISGMIAFPRIMQNGLMQFLTPN